MALNRNPLIIGATGGSGTRVFVDICHRLGYYMGESSNLNISNDAMVFVSFLNKWTNRFLMSNSSSMSPQAEERMRSELDYCAQQHYESAPITPEHWGWKNPRSMLILPILNSQFPRMRFIHVIRDGRDMATSSNQNQPKNHGPALLGEIVKDMKEYELAIRFWMETNCHAADYAENNMDDRYLRIRYEDLCSSPAAALLDLINFIAPPIDCNIEELTKLINPSRTIGRYRNSAYAADMTETARSALLRFGYQCT